MGYAYSVHDVVSLLIHSVGVVVLSVAVLSDGVFLVSGLLRHGLVPVQGELGEASCENKQRAKRAC